MFDAIRETSDSLEFNKKLATEMLDKSVNDFRG